MQPFRFRVSKVAVTQLIERINLLEETLKEHDIPVPPIAGDPKKPGTPGSSSEPGASGPPQDSAWQVLSPGGQRHGSVEAQNEQELNREKTLIDAFDGPAPAGEEGIEAALDQLSKRMGSLRVAEDGQLRYYGATSNMHILRSSVASPSGSIPSLVAQDNSTAILVNNGVGQYVAPELEDHLIKLYLAWENPFIHVVDEEAFLDARRKVTSCANPKESFPSYYSALLVNAMCALGACFTNRTIVDLPEPLSDFFETRAKVLLEADMDSPTVATVQALVIMSAIEAAYMRDARGWLYSGMALRLAVDLGLQMKPDDYVRSGELSLQEATTRKVAFWGTYFLDLGWSYYVGRLTMHIDDDGITIPIPSRSEDKGKVWEPYVDDQPGTYPKVYQDTLNCVLEHQVSLYSIMRALQKTFYDKKTGSISGLQRQMKGITADLLRWKQTLPPEISIDPTKNTGIHLPHALLLHMQYHEVIIFANHPLISIPGKMVATDTRRRCAESARSIALFLQLYKQWWSLRRMNIQGVHTIFSAALIHLHVACTSETESIRDLAVADLGLCCEALSDLSRAFGSAVRALDSLARTRQLWQSWLETPATPSTAKGPFSPPPPSFVTPDARRWIAIDDVIGRTSAMIHETPPTEEVSWLEGWMQMQSMTTEADPFSMAYATV
ncbi:hypothetical protein FQN54_007167 [Arachnomyces sp. PD_36]|nr:hypothetical protein FQN54_007167 [Arachnomyces sp. PD_36]